MVRRRRPPRMEVGKAMTPVGDVLKTVLAGMEIPEALASRGRALLRWPEVAGEAAAHSQTAGFTGTTLLVEAEDTSWLQELSLRKAEFLEKIAREVGEGVVDDIRFRLKKG